MTSTPDPPPAAGRSRRIELARAGWGTALLVAPRQVMTTVHHVGVDTKSLAIARILGARQLTQAVLSGLRPSPEVLAMGVWVDAVHAMTALGLAALDRSRARAGLIDTAIAALWAVIGYRDLVSAQPTPPAHQRHRDQLARIVLGVLPAGAPLLRRAAAGRRQTIGADGDGGPHDVAG
jgi:hypothetical protein